MKSDFSSKSSSRRFNINRNNVTVGFSVFNLIFEIKNIWKYTYFFSLFFNCRIIPFYILKLQETYGMLEKLNIKIYKVFLDILILRFYFLLPPSILPTMWIFPKYLYFGILRYFKVF